MFCRLQEEALREKKILDILINIPKNVNQLSTELNMDYKTIQHHLKVMEKNKLIGAVGGYGALYTKST